MMVLSFRANKIVVQSLVQGRKVSFSAVLREAKARGSRLRRSLICVNTTECTWR